MASARVVALILVVTLVASALGKPKSDFLTDEEVDEITTLLNVHVGADLGTHGVGIFLALFEAHPEYQKLFSKFADKPVEDLAEDKNLLGHAVRILEAFATKINENMHSKEKLEQAFFGVGKSHIRKTVGPTHVKNLIITLKEYFVKHLGELYSGAMSSGMNKVFEQIQAGFERANAA